MTEEKETTDDLEIETWIENHPILATLYAKQSKTLQEFNHKILKHINKGGNNNE